MTSPAELKAFLDTIPDPEPPPPGIIANFDGPNTNGTALIVVAVIGIFIATFFTVVRVYTKSILTRSLGWDDFASVLTLIGAIVWTATNIKLVGLGMGVQIWNYRRPYITYQLYAKTTLVTNSSYFVTVCLVKVTILMLYLRTFTESKRFRYIVYGVIFALVSTHLVTLTLFLAEVTPFRCKWEIYPTDEEYWANCSTNYDLLPPVVFISVVTIVLDIVILVLPCPAVWKLHMAKRQKIAILMLLMAGVIVTIASILRLIYLLYRFYYDQFANTFYTEFQVNLISTVEIDTAIACACLPTLKAFLKRFMPKILGSSVNKPSAYGYRNSTKGAQLPSGSHNTDRKWQSYSHEERLTAPYLELDEDGKSNKSYAMESIQPQSA